MMHCVPPTALPHSGPFAQHAAADCSAQAYFAPGAVFRAEDIEQAAHASIGAQVPTAMQAPISHLQLETMLTNSVPTGVPSPKDSLSAALDDISTRYDTTRG